MQISWVEKLASNGAISARVKDAIYRDCGALVKAGAAGKADVVMEWARRGEAAGLVAAKAGLTMLGAALGEEALDHLRDKYQTSSALKNIIDTRAAVLAHPDLRAHPDQAQARFDEIAQLAPLVAGNRPVMQRLVISKLHSGLTDQDVNSLALMQAAYTSPRLKRMLAQSLEKSAAAGKVNVAAAERLGTMYADCLHLVKEASGTKEVGKAVRDMLGRMLVFSAVPLIAGAGAGAVRELMARRDKAELEQRHQATFQRALDLANPDTSPLHREPEKARQAFQSLVHFAPHVAAEPNAAKAFMEKLVAYDMGIHTDEVKNLTDIERNIRQSGSGSPFLSGLAAGTKSLGLEGAMRENVKQFHEDIS